MALVLIQNFYCDFIGQFFGQVVPANAVIAKVECYGPGGAGLVYGGGGGSWMFKSVPVVAGQSFDPSVGIQGQRASNGTATTPTATTVTINGVLVCKAVGGANATAGGPGAGGSPSSGIGDSGFSGGNGATTSAIAFYGGGGGGGARGVMPGQPGSGNYGGSLGGGSGGIRFAGVDVANPVQGKGGGGGGGSAFEQIKGYWNNGSTGKIIVGFYASV